MRRFVVASVAGPSALFVVVLVPVAVFVGARSDARADEVSSDEFVPLARYYRSLAERRLVAPETGSPRQLAELVSRGQELVLDRRFDEAALVLFEACESPRFSDFEGSAEASHAEYLLGGALLELGAYRSAAHYLSRIVRRGASAPYFGPAYRRLVDVALRSSEIGRILEALERLGEDALTDDTRNELRYLRARARYEAGDFAGADAAFATVGRRSRFYANAQYLRGVIATRAGRLDEAEALFCSIATTPDTDRFTFYVDRRYFDVRDLTWLALGRVAHERGRADDAFYYYFQVPEDSRRVSEALFESAWAMYEGRDAETAIDLLDQLEARFPSSPFVDEAALLRGYVHLDRCEFDEANRLFVRFAEVFEPVRDEVERILASESRRGRLVEDLVAIEARLERGSRPTQPRTAGERDPRETLLALLRVDPTFFRLISDLRMLDAEAARSARLAIEIGAMEARLSGADAPEAAAAALGSMSDELTRTRRDIEIAREALTAMTGQLDAMRAAGASTERLEPLEAEVQSLERRLVELEARLERAAGSPRREVSRRAGQEADLETLLEADRRLALGFEGRAAEVRARLVEAIRQTTLRALEDLRSRLGANLRRARIGRIDAVMGSKRRIELQIESLSAGRFPPELLDPLRMQGLLRDDEEYWPFEGELWADEIDEATRPPSDAARGERR